MFLDFVKISVKSGDGGRGCVSFRREKYVPKGGPNGGDGGNGGSIIFKATTSLSTLIDFRYNRHYRAGRGEHGKGGDKNGKNGKDSVILIPCGSIIRDEQTDEVLAELLKDGEEVVLLKGGKGGKGNTHFKSSTNRAPRFAEDGKPGEEKLIIIELKLIADVGLVGFPNAGKSTLISKISAAKPKIADYPFTTLIPNLGIVKYKDYKSFVVADIPGIIRGASVGKGLGLQFLRHIERTKVLLFMIDSTAVNDENIFDEYFILLNELKNYSTVLMKKPRVLCFTKSDLLSKEQLETLQKILQKKKQDKFKVNKIIISSVTGKNIKELKDLLFKKLTEEKYLNETNDINLK
jgi:GTP-binding protein